MTDEKKLPLALQLVGLTAAVIFCFSAISAFNYGRALWLNREVIASVLNRVELFLPFAISIAVCASSTLAFLLLLARPVRSAALSSIAYLIFLLLLLAWQTVTLFVHPSEVQRLFAFGLVIKLCYAAWLGGLLLKVWPNYSFKRTADVGLR